MPKQAGANSVSHLLMTRPDGHQMLTGLTLSLPPGAVGNIANAPLCPAATVAALESNPGLNCPASSKVGNIKTTVGSGDAPADGAGIASTSARRPAGDAASLVIVVPAKAGPIDLGEVVLDQPRRAALIGHRRGRVHQRHPEDLRAASRCRLRKIEITVDRPGFFLNPTGCEPRTAVATFDAHEGGSPPRTMMLPRGGLRRRCRSSPSCG